MSAPLSVPDSSKHQHRGTTPKEYRVQLAPGVTTSVVRLSAGDAGPGVGVRVEVRTLDSDARVDWGLAEIGEGCDGPDECLAEWSTFDKTPVGLLCEITGGTAVGWILVARAEASADGELVVRLVPPGAPCAAPAVRLGPAAG